MMNSQIFAPRMDNLVCRRIAEKAAGTVSACKFARIGSLGQTMARARKIGTMASQGRLRACRAAAVSLLAAHTIRALLRMQQAERVRERVTSGRVVTNDILHVFSDDETVADLSSASPAIMLY